MRSTQTAPVTRQTNMIARGFRGCVSVMWTRVNIRSKYLHYGLPIEKKYGRVIKIAARVMRLSVRSLCCIQ